MFSITSPLSKMMVVAVIVFFPVMVNTLRGLTEVDHNEIELMRSAATPRQILCGFGSRRPCPTSSAP